MMHPKMDAGMGGAKGGGGGEIGGEIGGEGGGAEGARGEVESVGEAMERGLLPLPLPVHRIVDLCDALLCAEPPPAPVLCRPMASWTFVTHCCVLRCAAVCNCPAALQNAVLLVPPRAVSFPTSFFQSPPLPLCGGSAPLATPTVWRFSPSRHSMRPLFARTPLCLIPPPLPPLPGHVAQRAQPAPNRIHLRLPAVAAPSSPLCATFPTASCLPLSPPVASSPLHPLPTGDMAQRAQPTPNRIHLRLPAVAAPSSPLCATFPTASCLPLSPPVASSPLHPLPTGDMAQRAQPTPNRIHLRLPAVAAPSSPLCATFPTASCLPLSPPVASSPLHPIPTGDMAQRAQPAPNRIHLRLPAVAAPSSPLCATFPTASCLPLSPPVASSPLHPLPTGDMAQRAQPAPNRIHLRLPAVAAPSSPLCATFPTASCLPLSPPVASSPLHPLPTGDMAQRAQPTPNRIHLRLPAVAAPSSPLCATFPTASCLPLSPPVASSPLHPLPTGDMAQRAQPTPNRIHLRLPAVAAPSSPLCATFPTASCLPLSPPVASSPLHPLPTGDMAQRAQPAPNRIHLRLPAVAAPSSPLCATFPTASCLPLSPPVASSPLHPLPTGDMAQRAQPTPNRIHLRLPAVAAPSSPLCATFPTASCLPLSPPVASSPLHPLPTGDMAQRAQPAPNRIHLRLPAVAAPSSPLCATFPTASCLPLSPPVASSPLHPLPTGDMAQRAQPAPDRIHLRLPAVAAPSSPLCATFPTASCLPLSPPVASSPLHPLPTGDMAQRAQPAPNRIHLRLPAVAAPSSPLCATFPTASCLPLSPPVASSPLHPLPTGDMAQRAQPAPNRIHLRLPAVAAPSSPLCATFPTASCLPLSPPVASSPLHPLPTGDMAQRAQPTPNRIHLRLPAVAAPSSPLCATFPTASCLPLSPPVASSPLHPLPTGDMAQRAQPTPNRIHLRLPAVAAPSSPLCATFPTASCLPLSPPVASSPLHPLPTGDMAQRAQPAPNRIHLRLPAVAAPSSPLCATFPTASCLPLSPPVASSPLHPLPTGDMAQRAQPTPNRIHLRLPAVAAPSSPLCATFPTASCLPLSPPVASSPLHPLPTGDMAQRAQPAPDRIHLRLPAAAPARRPFRLHGLPLPLPLPLPPPPPPPPPSPRHHYCWRWCQPPSPEEDFVTSAGGLPLEGRVGEAAVAPLRALLAGIEGSGEGDARKGKVAPLRALLAGLEGQGAGMRGGQVRGSGRGRRGEWVGGSAGEARGQGRWGSAKGTGQVERGQGWEWEWPARGRQQHCRAGHCWWGWKAVANGAGGDEERCGRGELCGVGGVGTSGVEECHAVPLPRYLLARLSPSPLPVGTPVPFPATCWHACPLPRYLLARLSPSPLPVGTPVPFPATCWHACPLPRYLLARLSPSPLPVGTPVTFPATCWHACPLPRYLLARLSPSPLPVGTPVTFPATCWHACPLPRYLLARVSPSPLPVGTPVTFPATCWHACPLPRYLLARVSPSPLPVAFAFFTIISTRIFTPMPSACVYRSTHPTHPCKEAEAVREKQQQGDSGLGPALCTTLMRMALQGVFENSQKLSGLDPALRTTLMRMALQGVFENSQKLSGLDPALRTTLMRMALQGVFENSQKLSGLDPALRTTLMRMALQGVFENSQKLSGLDPALRTTLMRMALQGVFENSQKLSGLDPALRTTLMRMACLPLAWKAPASGRKEQQQGDPVLSGLDPALLSALTARMQFRLALYDALSALQTARLPAHLPACALKIQLAQTALHKLKISLPPTAPAAGGEGGERGEGEQAEGGSGGQQTASGRAAPGMCPAINTHLLPPTPPRPTHLLTWHE
ncbi:unnamed protein product, partial [Closterium sp. NIES-65]